MRSNLLASAIAVGLGLAAVAPARAADDTAAQLAAMKAQIAALQAQVEELQAQTDAQSDVNVTQAKAIEAAQATNTKADALEKLVNNTKVSGRIFFDATSLEQESDGTKINNTGIGFDVKRFYVGIDHKFDDKWSANITTDFQYSSAVGATEVFLKKAYLQGKFSDAFTLRIGSADMPWIPFAEGYYGYRYVENTLVDRLKYGNSADWGFHAGGTLGDGMFNYAASVVSGGGYKNPSRSKGMDVEGRVGFAPTQSTIIAIGAYSGHQGLETESTDALHTANRFDALAAWSSPKFRLGAEYFQAKNWSRELATTSDKADGYSLWGSAVVTQGGISVFGRYDSADLSKDLNPSLTQKYYNLGVEFPIVKGFKLAAVFKHTDQDSDTTADLKTNEFGVWGDVQW
ncbi:carbohydrate porin [Pseudoluteimonas lycopersici]|uniref:Carbohydrate porin n=1 Tax=Pseudoluteimonas lycopersici TaxID=1324796 RepID=A0A516V428_9GAMM|nr:porin [Lysobacter lycopersici]QDQ73237.1 carbohydrate porin [Lysobacter lycopersici]